jgi:hypothetical protein
MTRSHLRRHRLAMQQWSSTALLALLIVCFGGGCTVRLIGDYDSTIDQGVSDLQQKAEVYFAKLQSAPATGYDQSVYDDLDARLAVLKSRAASLPKYGIIAQQVTNLKAQVDDFQKLDKMSPRPLASIIITGGESSIAVSVESILKLELALKRGENPPETPVAAAATPGAPTPK